MIFWAKANLNLTGHSLAKPKIAIDLKLRSRYAPTVYNELPRSRAARYQNEFLPY